MAEEYIDQGGVCSGNWWNPSRNTLFAGGCFSPCSGAAGDLAANFGWAPVDSDWTQAMLFGGCTSSGIRSSNQTNFESDPSQVVHESGSSDSSQIHSDWSPGLAGSFAGKPVEDHEDTSPMSAFKNQMNYANHSVSYPSALVKSFLLDDQLPAPPPLFEDRLNHSAADYSPQMVPNYGLGCSGDSLPASFGKLSSLLKPVNSSPLHQNSPQPGRLHFSNNTPYWNATVSALEDIRAGLLDSPQSSHVGTSVEEKPNRSNLNAKASSQYPQVSGSIKKKPSPEPAFKRPRIETPSPLPTFKVRKEKLGDRITALQQLVSPFGKTDTASVLHEAIDYIKFLHDQVHTLSAPYMKTGHQVLHQQVKSTHLMEDKERQKKDLRSRGLCLVPISSTFPVTSEAQTDIWTPIFGGTTYR